jgi:hypothetical protein
MDTPRTQPQRAATRQPLRTLLVSLLAIGVAPLLLSSTAQAGCGCDHPPPEWSPVMPIFAPVGATIRIHEDGNAFDVGSHYDVEIDGQDVADAVVAEHAGYLDVRVPEGVDVGPARIEVSKWKRGWFGWYAHEVTDYDSSYFTVLSDFVSLPDEQGLFETGEFEIAVDSDGAILIPIDLTNVLDPHQFAFQFTNLALSFGPEDVVIYNKDGVDLTFFTLAVDDSSKRKWGSYHGWEVEEDQDLMGVRYNNRTGRAWDLARASDVLTYWRHEFRTYAFAHMEGMSLEVDADGYHPDGSLHIDHDFIVLAIKGMERSRHFSWSSYFDRDLRPGSREVNMRALMERSKHPIEPERMINWIEKGRPNSLSEFMRTYKGKRLELEDLDEWLYELGEDEQEEALEKLEMTIEEAVLAAVEADDDGDSDDDD